MSFIHFGNKKKISTPIFFHIPKSLYVSKFLNIMSFMPRDVIACVTLGGGFLLLFSGIDGIIGSMLLAVTMFYFGAETLEKRKRDAETEYLNSKVLRRK